ncbi:unnamed protein product [Trypanosoma congolense IL3000]|uniref:WGS project CAEQ00000000 data, annotated contig 803 n=1 Tax=Trypanosoma congolense (strain IL3000) TaxID=1068625 RepID=F9WIJ5_TRYCI|nr:unnamed protein product [Trypanosoma congolense IL3000]
MKASTPPPSHQLRECRCLLLIRSCYVCVCLEPPFLKYLPPTLSRPNRVPWTTAGPKLIISHTVLPQDEYGCLMYVFLKGCSYRGRQRIRGRAGWKIGRGTCSDGKDRCFLTCLLQPTLTVICGLFLFNLFLEEKKRISEHNFRIILFFCLKKARVYITVPCYGDIMLGMVSCTYCACNGFHL